MYLQGLYRVAFALNLAFALQISSVNNNIYLLCFICLLNVIFVFNSASWLLSPTKPSSRITILLPLYVDLVQPV